MHFVANFIANPMKPLIMISRIVESRFLQDAIRKAEICPTSAMDANDYHSIRLHTLNRMVFERIETAQYKFSWLQIS